MQKFHDIDFDACYVFHFRKIPKRVGNAITAVVLLRGSLVIIATATCSASDNFNKKIGKAIAYGRAKKALAGGYVETHVGQRKIPSFISSVSIKEWFPDSIPSSKSVFAWVRIRVQDVVNTTIQEHLFT